ncbi:MAG: MerR family transcriptional regulator [Lachnospiraceae bacterium]|nr:MerR family transcriptional regulator [Lachnospiraceae bacterium]
MGLSPGGVRPESNRKGAFPEVTHYLISEASRKLNVEAHVLRYWEEELKLEIPRNELGHRYYTEKQLALFQKIKELKELGYQLKAIKTSLREEYGPEEKAKEAGFLLEPSEGQEKRFKILEGQTTEKESESKENSPGEVELHIHGAEQRGKENGTGHLDQLSRRLSASSSGPMTEAVLEKMTGKLAETMGKGAKEQEILPFAETDEERLENTEEQTSAERLETEISPETADEEGREAMLGKKDGRSQEGEETGRQDQKSGEEADRQKAGQVTALELVENGGLAASPEKMQQFQTIMTDVLAEALRRNQESLSQEVGGRVSEKLVKEMNYLMRDREEREEERYRKLDETIRACQRVQRQKSEAAATRVPVRGMKKSRFPWGRRKDS